MVDTAHDIPIALVVAVAANGVIGRSGELPWHVPEDLQHFRRITWGAPLIMGRKTYESIGRPLPGRVNIVLSSSLTKLEGCYVVENLSAAIEFAQQQALKLGAKEIMVIGGANVYRQSLDLAQRIYMTRIADDQTQGDSYFPELQEGQWETQKSGSWLTSSTGIDYQFVILNKKL